MDFSNLKKGLFSLKKSSPEDTNQLITDTGKNINFKEYGFERCNAHQGSSVGLRTCLGRIFHEYKEDLRRNEEKQVELKKPLNLKLQQLKSEMLSLNSNIDKFKTINLPDAKKKIVRLNSELIEIKKHPEQFSSDKVGKAGIYIGGIILLFLTIYLFIFYSSATYSAFFKEFSLNELGVANSIFDAKALSKALKDGFTELALILTIPFVFLGLGYLIHKFQQFKSWKMYFKITALIVVTFVFDTILAYEITEKIYNVNKENSFKNIPDYSMKLAFESVSFWLIIFAGFVVYLIWGFVFDFFMDSCAQQDKVTMSSMGKKVEIKEAEKELKQYESQLEKDQLNSNVNNSEINKLQEMLNSPIVRPQDFQGIVHQFSDGWFQWMSANLKSKQDLVDGHDIVNEFISSNLNNSEFISLNGHQK